MCAPPSSSPEQQESGRVLDSTEASRERYRANTLSYIAEGLLPAISVFFAIYNIFELFSDNAFLGCGNLVIFFVPSILVLLFYAENMMHRENKLMEAGLIVALGPLLRWLCSVCLLMAKPDVSEDFRDLKAFATATRVIDGVFQGSLHIIWLLYLIATDIYPFPGLEKRTKTVTDHNDNVMKFPVLSSFGLYPAFLVLVKNLFLYWRLHHPRATTQDGSTTVLVQEDATR